MDASNRTSGGYHQILILLVLLVSVPAIVMAAGLPQADLNELRREIEANGYQFEVDDHFSSTITPEQRFNLRSGFSMNDDDYRELDQHLKIYPVDKDPLPTSLNWADLGGVTGVRNQGECGSCWAFAATAELESFVKIYYGEDMNLSEQQSVSCNPYGSSCDGGWAAASYYVFQHQGAASEGCMPYIGADPPAAPCIEEGLKKYGYITGYNYISNNVQQMKEALQYGPICTGISATDAFENYSGGCFDEYGSGINHLVLIVGYDDRSCDNEGSWIIKNSWGYGFGDGGYAKVRYGRAGTGSSVTQMQYVAPPVSIDLTGGISGAELMAGETREINWTTSGAAVSSVDIWLGLDNQCNDILLASNVPNDGSYDWVVPNHSTNFASLVIHPSGSTTEEGYGKTQTPMKILGHQLRYVSDIGSNTAPYDTPATAAHNISDALNACTGVDTVLVTGGNYVDAFTISGPITLLGGYSNDFSVRDTDLYISHIYSGLTGLRFLSGSEDKGGVDGFIFEDCAGSVSSEPVGGRHGGAIYVRNASPRITNCDFLNNTAHPSGNTGYGGAICIVGGEPFIENCSFTGNTATKGGAMGIFDGAVVTMENCNFDQNDCTDGFNSNVGGAIAVENSSLIMNGGRISNVTLAYQGAAIYSTDSNVTLQGVEISSNQSTENGGGVFNLNGFLQMSGCQFINNIAQGGSGGGAFSNGSNVTVRNVHFSGNSSTILGGGMTAMDASGTVENCLFANNSSSTGGGLMFLANSTSVVRNNVLVNNEGLGLVAVGTDLMADYNNVVGNQPSDYGTSIPGAHDISLDPLFVDAGANDFGLAQFSPCVDSGQDDASCLDPDGSRADMGLLGGPNANFIAPLRVAGADIMQLGAGEVRITWDASSEEDIAYYVVYRDTAVVFVPSDLRAVATVDHPSAVFDDTPPFDCYYLMVAVDSHGYSSGYSERVYTSEQVSGVGDDQTPRVLAISGVVPNPFNPMTTVKFDLPRSGKVNLAIFDLRGRLVRNLVSGQMEAGSHDVVWNGRDDRGQHSAAGVYFARLNSADGTRTIKMVLAK